MVYLGGPPRNLAYGDLRLDSGLCQLAQGQVHPHLQTHMGEGSCLISSIPTPFPHVNCQMLQVPQPSLPQAEPPFTLKCSIANNTASSAGNLGYIHPARCYRLTQPCPALKHTHGVYSLTQPAVSQT